VPKQPTTPPPSTIKRKDPPPAHDSEVARLLQGRKLLTSTQVADMLGYTPDALRVLRHQGGGPPYIAISNQVVRYRLPDVEAWLQARTKART
jgi:hypothetical protein